MNIDQLHIIRQIFEAPLPGSKAHAFMARNLNRANLQVPDNVKLAAVMLLLFPNDKDELQITLTERSKSHGRDSHSGQMAFPGGKKDPGDSDLEFTAIRETKEEVGIDPSQLEVLGALTTLYIPVSNFLVHPYVGYIDHTPSFEKEEREVAEIITCGLSDLITYETPSTTEIKIGPSLRLKDVPYFDIQGKVVWGATSMILQEFLMAVRAQL